MIRENSNQWLQLLSIDTAEVFTPLLDPARYKAAHGGRGSGKSHFFAGLLIEDSLREPGETGAGLLSVCIREVQKDLAQSSKRLIETKLADFRLGEADGFKVFRDVISCPGDGLMIFKGMQDYTAESIKSLEGYKRAWWTEAQSAASMSLSMLRPTIRVPGSELWFDWNPRRKADPVDNLFRTQTHPTGSVVISANWRDNPWFPDVLEQERQDCLANEPDQYEHIWEGGYVTIAAGAYFARDLTLAAQQGRIGRVAADPLMTLRAFWDIGGTGNKSDATAIWIAQFIGREIRVLDYYEVQGQPLEAHVNWLRSKGYGKALCILPHDGQQSEKVYSVTYEGALRSAGFEVETVKNQGAGAAMLRVEAVRRLFPSIWFNKDTTEPGRDALGWYHEKHDPKRNIGLGPDHDWSSHAADAFGLMAVAYEAPKVEQEARKVVRRVRSSGAWMGA